MQNHSGVPVGCVRKLGSKTVENMELTRVKYLW
jgi:hypothetical protein